LVQKLISLEEAARISDTEPSWWKRKVRRGEIPAVKLGRQVRLRIEDLEQILKRGYPPRPVTEGPRRGSTPRRAERAGPRATLDPEPSRVAGSRP